MPATTNEAKGVATLRLPAEAFPRISWPTSTFSPEQNAATMVVRAPSEEQQGALTSMVAFRWLPFYRTRTEEATDSDTQFIEARRSFYNRVLERLARPGSLIPADEVLGDLDADD